jgi:hypothetical protein
VIVTFVGSFDNKDIYAMHVTASMLDIVPFTEERIKELKTEPIYYKERGYSCKLSFNKNNRLEKIIFRKEKK